MEAWNAVNNEIGNTIDIEWLLVSFGGKYNALFSSIPYSLLGSDLSLDVQQIPRPFLTAADIKFHGRHKVLEFALH